MKQYMLVVAWNDGTCKTEISDLSSILGAIQIYYEDPDFFIAHIIDCATNHDIAQFQK